MKHDQIKKFIFSSGRVFLLLWSLLFQQTWATHEFYRGPTGTLIVDHSASIPSSRELTKAKGRVFQLARALANGSGVSRDLRQRAARLQSKASTLPLSGERLTQGFDEIRDMLAAMQALHGDEIKTFIQNNEHLNKITTLPQERNLHESILTAENTPSYCERYPLVDRDALSSFYDQAGNGEGLECYSPGGNNVGLDFNDIAQAMLSVEGNLYEKQSKDLQNKLVNKSIMGIMSEAQSFSGLFPNTDFPSEELLQCANRHARRTMDNRELSGKIQELQNSEKDNIEKLNTAFGSEEKRLEAFIANQVREALVLGNLYQITSQARRHREEQVARIGGDEREIFAPNIVEQCLSNMEEEYGFSYPDQHNNSFSIRLEQRCRSFVEEGKYSSRVACLQSYRELMQNSTQLERAQNRCYYQASGRENDAPKYIKADLLIPMMSASVESNPLLFNREDNRSFVPFVSSESNYIPSNLANSILSIDGAHDISNQIEELLATNPENPKEVIDQYLASPEAREKLKGIISKAKSDPTIKNNFQKEIANYKNELAESATNVCESDGEHLHQFPNLVENVIADELSQTNDPSEKQRILARTQAAQCWLLKEDPPEEDGGLPGGYIALGVGAIALGLVPGVGLIASAALMSAGTALTASDSYLRFSHSQDRLNATTAAFQGGWADSQEVLLSASQRTDAQTMLYAEALGVGILDVASPAARALFRGLRASDEIIDVNQYMRLPDSVLEVGTKNIGDYQVPLRIKASNYRHMQEHDFPGGISYVDDLIGKIGDREVSIDFLQNFQSANAKGNPFQRILKEEGLTDGTITIDQMIALAKRYKRPKGQHLSNAINTLLDDMPDMAFRKGKATTLFDEDVRLDEVINAIKNNKGTLRTEKPNSNAFILNYRDREYRVHYCLKRSGCNCGHNGTCTKRYGDIDSIYPQCGKGIYMLNRRASFVDAMVDGSFRSSSYLENRDYVAKPIRGVSVGKFNDGLIREVSCD